MHPHTTPTLLLYTMAVALESKHIRLMILTPSLYLFRYDDEAKLCAENGVRALSCLTLHPTAWLFWAAEQIGGWDWRRKALPVMLEGCL